MKRRQRNRRTAIGTEQLELRELLSGTDFGDATTHKTLGDIAGPELAELGIAGDGLTVYPEFSPDILRYALVPTADTGVVTVTPEAADGNARVRVDGKIVRNGRIKLPGLQPSQTVAIDVELDGVTRTYELFYTPEEYPLEVLTNSPGAAPGSYYTTPLNFQGGNNAYITKTDRYGVPEFLKEVDQRSFDFKRHANGQYSYATNNGFNEFNRRDNVIVLLNEQFEEVDRVGVIGPGMNHTDFHDFQILPNGNHVFVSYNGVIRDGQLWEDSIVQVVNPETKEEILRWNSFDDIDIDTEVILGRNRLPEWAHINSVFADENGDFIVSLRWTSSIVKFDGETGETIWRLGGTKSDFEINDPLGGPCGQHTAQILENGNLIYYDNGTGCPNLPEYAARAEEENIGMRYVEYSLDEENMTADLVYDYMHPTYAPGPTGSVQVLPNGNRLISWGLPGRSFTEYSTMELDPTGKIVREIDFDRFGQFHFSYRAFYADDPTYPTLAADNGASHTIVDGFHLGSGVDGESDAAADPGGLGDDSTGGDEDGVLFSGKHIPGRNGNVNVTASGEGLLNAWVDFNQDGDWDDPNEQIFTDQPLVDGMNRLSYALPADAITGNTYTRFRFSTEAGLTPEGHADDGEVEDHKLVIERMTPDKLTQKELQAVFGEAVTMQGNLAVVGAKLANETSGEVYIYERLGNNHWVLQKTLESPRQGNDQVGGDRFGVSVDLDGDTLVVGAIREENSSGDLSSGAVYVFGRNQGGENNWGLLQRLRSPVSGRGDQFGNAVAIDGNHIVVGSRGEDTSGRFNTGAAYIFENVGGTWQQAAHLTLDGATRDDKFAWSVDISGGTVIVGAPFYDHEGMRDAGTVAVYEKKGPLWNLARQIHAPDGHNNIGGGDRFGASVSIDGDTAIVGAYLEEDGDSDVTGGAAYVLSRDAGGPSNWGIVQKLRPNDATELQQFGYSIDFDGRRIAIGARLANHSTAIKSGAVYLYEVRRGKWTQIDKLQAQDAGTKDHGGSAVALSGEYTIMGSPLDNAGGKRDAGAAYIFHNARADELNASSVRRRAGVESVTVSDVESVLDAAKDHWREDPLTEEQKNALETVSVGVGNLPGTTIGVARPTEILFDRTAAGHGWYVDATPFDLHDDEIGSRIDLLSAVIHELGHVIGHDHDESSAVMKAEIDPGERFMHTDADHTDDVFATLHADLNNGLE